MDPLEIVALQIAPHGNDQMGDAYAEAWALSHYLIQRKKEAYVKYLGTLAAKPRLVTDSPQERIAEFRAAGTYRDAPARVRVAESTKEQKANYDIVDGAFAQAAGHQPDE